MNKYYDGVKILSMLDINGRKPEIYIVTSNRTGGKTTYFNRLCVNRWLDRKEKFAVLYRFKYELDDVVDKFFNDIQSLFFPDHVMTCKKIAKGIACQLMIDDVVCGYAIALNSADQIKKYSHMFNDVMRIVFDEFQSETNQYCPDELKKFQSIHTSIARGQGEQVRYVPVYMISNPVSIINPYYVKFGISVRLRTDTKFLKGDGFVMEQGFNESASKAQLESGFNRAFGVDDYVAYSAQAVYLNDNYSFVEKPNGRSKYVCTLKYNGGLFSVREFPELGIIYCDDKADATFPFKITVTTDDHQINYVMLKNNDIFLINMRYFFEKGCFRFKDLRCKEAILASLSY